MLDEGLAIILMFIGAKMLAEPWLHISTGVSLGVVGGLIAIAVLASIIAEMLAKKQSKPLERNGIAEPGPSPIAKVLERLANKDAKIRLMAARYLFSEGTVRIAGWLDGVQKDEEFRNLLVRDRFERPVWRRPPRAQIDGRHRGIPRGF